MATKGGEGITTKGDDGFEGDVVVDRGGRWRVEMSVRTFGGHDRAASAGVGNCGWCVVMTLVWVGEEDKWVGTMLGK